MKFVLNLGLTFFALILITSCSESKNELGEKYFETYTLRNDFNRFKSFYNDTILYENVVLQTGLNKISTNELINTNFSWNDKQMVYQNGKILEVESMISNDTLIVASGKFLPYLYQGMQVPEMKFSTWLYLDKNKKIKKQIDWFNYPIEDIIQAYQMKQSMNISSSAIGN